ncbi:MAG TPA: XF1762 family protein [Thermoleophilia bacterium]|nr:XF1762 family protein [Thermoleophilia bacterium]
MVSRLTVVPCTLDDANAFIRQHHRHHQPVIGHRFSVAVADASGEIRGVAIIGRPVARRLDDGLTLEVTRVATDGCHNACSALYGAARRAAFALGYMRIGTYTLASEPGTSLVASGWKSLGERGGGSWSRRSRPRVDQHPLQSKIRWEAVP